MAGEAKTKEKEKITRRRTGNSLGLRRGKRDIKYIIFNF